MSRISHLLRPVAALAFLAAAGCQDETAAGEAVALPSGRAVTFLDMITDAPGPKGATARFRFVAPDLRADEDAGEDMAALCTLYALPRVPDLDPVPQQVVIVLADRAVPFGEAAPDAVQFFEAYSIKDGACIWELL